MVGAGSASSRQSLGRAPVQIHCRRAGADHDVLAQRAVVPKRLDRGLPPVDHRHLVEQEGHRLGGGRQLLRALHRRGQLGQRPAFEEIESEVGDAPRRPRPNRALHEKLQRGRLADLPRSPERVDTRLFERNLVDHRCGQSLWLVPQLPKVRIGLLPARLAPPAVLPQDLSICEGHQL